MKTKAPETMRVWLQIRGDYYLLSRNFANKLFITKYVQNQQENSYALDLVKGSCTCPDYQNHQGSKQCKHLRALAALTGLLEKAYELEEPVLTGVGSEEQLPQ